MSSISSSKLLPECEWPLRVKPHNRDREGDLREPVGARSPAQSALVAWTHQTITMTTKATGGSRPTPVVGTPSLMTGLSRFGVRTRISPPSAPAGSPSLASIRSRSRPFSAIPDLLRTDQPKRSIETRSASLRSSYRFLEPTAAQISERDACLVPCRDAEMLVNQFSETEPFVQFANQNQATVGSDVRTTLRSPLKLSWNGLVCFSHWDGVLIGSSPYE